MTDHTSPSANASEKDPSPDSAADAGSESPEEGAAAMATAEDAVQDD